MASYQRVALYVFFDAIERDLVDRIRSLPLLAETPLLTPDEAQRAARRLEHREGSIIDVSDQLALLSGLDLGDKCSVLMRHKPLMDQGAREYYSAQHQKFIDVIPIRNATMHGRPLTITELALGFQIANDFLRAGTYWPSLNHTYRQYTTDPHAFIGKAVELLDDEGTSTALNNLPVPDYEDTGFLSRPILEKELKKKILSRHPVITALGEGGNGKTALVLQTLYGMLASNDHGYDAIVWVSAKANKLTRGEIERIEGAITDSLDLFNDVAEKFEPGTDDPIERVRRLLNQNKVLLVIDNLETVLDETLRQFAADVPGESKLIFTSRVPLGSDLSVQVGEFDIKEARTYLRRLIEAYDVPLLRQKSNDELDAFTSKLSCKPLLLKWFALGVASGLSPEGILSRPDAALKFCMETVIDNLSEDSKNILLALSIVPIPLSPALLQYVLDLAAPHTEAGISEALRFGLIQRDERNQAEVGYHLKGFVKMFMSRLARPSATFSENILKKYRAIEATYQVERGGKIFNKYDSRAFLVRSKTEAISVQKLKKAIYACNQGNLSLAEEILQDAKIVSPEYFEVFRTEAALAIKTGDVARAQTAYEIALELADDQSQLHAAYAGFLSRYLTDYDRAKKRFARALELDPEAHYLLQEAARNALFAYDFRLAEQLITKAQILPLKTSRDAIIFADLTTQLYYREADFLTRTGDYDGVVRALTRFVEVVRSTDRKLFDDKHLDHLGKVHRLIADLRRSQFSADDLLEEVTTAVRTVENEVDPARGLPYMSEHEGQSGETRFGYLKIEGRAQTFGFLRDQHGADTYLSRYLVIPRVWEALCEGQRAVFSIAPGRDGRTAAVDVRLMP